MTRKSLLCLAIFALVSAQLSLMHTAVAQQDSSHVSESVPTVYSVEIPEPNVSYEPFSSSEKFSPYVHGAPSKANIPAYHLSKANRAAPKVNLPSHLKALEGDTKLNFAIFLPITSRGFNPAKQSLEELPLISVLLNSLKATVDRNYTYTVYVGFDYEDPVFDNDMHRRKIEAIYSKMLEGLPIYVDWTCVYAIRGVTPIWNLLARRAYEHGSDYFFAANDDLRIMTRGWQHRVIQALRSGPIFPNFGVAAMNDLTFPDFPTFNVAHRLHLELFELTFYPIPYPTGVADPWIFSTYKPFQSAHELTDIVVANYEGGNTAPRLSYDSPKGVDRQIIKAGLRLLDAYERMFADQPGVLPVTAADVKAYDGCLRFRDYCEREKRYILNNPRVRALLIFVGISAAVLLLILVVKNYQAILTKLRAVFDGLPYTKFQDYTPSSGEDRKDLHVNDSL